jgi:hypothetical protein
MLQAGELANLIATALDERAWVPTELVGMLAIDVLVAMESAGYTIIPPFDDTLDDDLPRPEGLTDEDIGARWGEALEQADHARAEVERREIVLDWLHGLAIGQPAEGVAVFEFDQDGRRALTRSDQLGVWVILDPESRVDVIAGAIRGAEDGWVTRQVRQRPAPLPGGEPADG